MDDEGERGKRGESKGGPYVRESSHVAEATSYATTCTIISLPSYSSSLFVVNLVFTLSNRPCSFASLDILTTKITASSF